MSREVHSDEASPDLSAFEQEVVSFLEGRADGRLDEGAFVWGEGADDVSVFEEVDAVTERAQLERAKTWRAARFDAGLGYLTGDVELGGRGLSPAHERLYNLLEAGYRIPDQTFFGIGLGMLAPTITTYAPLPVKQAYLAKLHRGDIVGCQLFSEPSAGSDLANVRTTAERDGDAWVINGQKVWTSGAHYSDLGEIICRTDPTAPKHKGLTVFLVDMRAPGVEVRPLRQMTGGAAFNEVFLEDVRIPDDHRLGEVNHGWGVAVTTLMNERASIGAGNGMRIPSTARLAALLQASGRSGDRALRNELMVIHSAFEVARLTAQRGLDNMKAGQAPGPEMSVGKLAVTQALTRTSAFVSRVLGPRLVADSGEWGTYAWSKFVCGTPGMRIGGGADEIQRNILGERVLGLPKEPVSPEGR